MDTECVGWRYVRNITIQDGGERVTADYCDAKQKRERKIVKERAMGWDGDG
jgi:hypothetical protein